jgi:hypothetical protein
MGIFSEYLNSKGKLDKPVVKDVADKVDVPANKAKAPPKATGQSKPGSYAATGGKKPKKAEKGFGDEGDKALVYDPEKACKHIQVPTAESIHAVKAAVEAISKNPFVVEHLIGELKKKNVLGVVVGEMFSHNESFGHLAEIMANESFGPNACRKLVKAMKEEVAPPYEDFGLDEFDGEEGMEDDEEGLEDEEMGDEEAQLGDEDMDFLSQMGAEEEEMPLDGEEVPMDGEVPPEEGMEDDGTGMVPQPPMPPAMEHLIRAINGR